MWTLTVLLLVLLDMMFLFGLRMSQGVSLSLTLLICGVVWLRTWMWQRFRGMREAHPAEWFGRVMDVAEGKRLAWAGIGLRWLGECCDRAMLDSSSVHALRSILREAVSNVIRHSGARQASVEVSHGNGSLQLRIEDDGDGCRDYDDTSGNKLSNMRARLARLGGFLELVARCRSRSPVPFRALVLLRHFHTARHPERGSLSRPTAREGGDSRIDSLDVDAEGE